MPSTAATRRNATRQATESVNCPACKCGRRNAEEDGGVTCPVSRNMGIIVPYDNVKLTIGRVYVQSNLRVIANLPVILGILSVQPAGGTGLSL